MTRNERTEEIREQRAEDASAWRDDAARWVWLGLAIIVLALGGALYFGMRTTIHGAIVAPGRVIVQSRPKVVQHPDGGVIRELLVSDGAFVRAGQPLLLLDDRAMQAELQAVSGQLDELRAEAARLQAERDGREAIDFPAGLRQRARSDPEIRRILQRQRQLFRVRRDTLRNQAEILRQRMRAIEKQIEGLESERRGRERQLQYVRRELKAVSALLQKGHETMRKFLDLKSREAGLEGVYGRVLGAIAQARKTIGETRLEAIGLQQRFRQQVLQRLSEVHERILQLSSRKAVLEERMRRSVVRAPVDGRVHDLQVHTVGGVVTAGKPVMRIIPQQDTLVVEARVPPTGIDQVFVGQKAWLYFPAFDRITTPELVARVQEVSPADSTDPVTGRSYYAVQLGIAPEQLRRLGEDNKLLPGMPVETFIQTHPRTPLQIITRPFRDTMRRAFREG